jgi:MFS family permease
MIRKKIELREERDFGQKFNAVFTFIQANFKSFIKVIGLTVGPLALIGGFFFGLFYTKVFSMMRATIGGDVPEIFGLTDMFLAYFLFGLALLWMIIAVYAFMAEYDDGNENITIEAIWKRGKGKILPAIGLGLLTIVTLTLFVALIFVFPGNDSGWGIAFKILLVFVVIIYVMIVLSLVLPNMVIDDLGVFESIERSFVLIRGKWWSTFGLLIVMIFISSVASYIFSIPFLVAWIVTLLLQTSAGETLTIIGSCIMFLGQLLMLVLPILAIGFQYFNLVERKEGTGLLKKIDQLGKSVNTANEGGF